MKKKKEVVKALTKAIRAAKEKGLEVSSIRKYDPMGYTGKIEVYERSKLWIDPWEVPGLGEITSLELQDGVLSIKFTVNE